MERRQKTIFKEWSRSDTQQVTNIEYITTAPLLFRVDTITLDEWTSGVIYRWVIIRVPNGKKPNLIDFTDGHDVYMPRSDVILSGQVHPGHQIYIQNPQSGDNDSSYFHIDFGDMVVFLIAPSNPITDKIFGTITYSVIMGPSTQLSVPYEETLEETSHPFYYYEDVPEVPNVDKMIQRWFAESPSHLTNQINIFGHLPPDEKVIIHHIYGIYHMLITNYARILYYHTNYLQYDELNFWMSKEFINELKQRLANDKSLTYYPIVDIIRQAKQTESIQF